MRSNQGCWWEGIFFYSIRGAASYARVSIGKMADWLRKGYTCLDEVPEEERGYRKRRQKNRSTYDRHINNPYEVVKRLKRRGIL